MTFREKLKLEHPECVGSKYVGGCNLCPHDYGYESSAPPTLPNCTHNCIMCWASGVKCKECWDREMPEKAEEKE